MSVLAWVGTVVIVAGAASLTVALLLGAAIRVSRQPDPPCREE